MNVRPDQLRQPVARPFFGYFGGKWRDTPRMYPFPKYNRVVEPFAGSAGYAVRHHYLDVVLVEADPVVAAVWRFLIGATRSEILSLPDVRAEASVDDIDCCDEAKWLIGFWLNRGVARPRKRPSKWMREGIRPGSFWGERVRDRIADQLELIRHWTVVEGDYRSVPDGDEPATWFIDPPYEVAGRHGSAGIDYDELGTWCRQRHGQVIVCEHTGASWLPTASPGIG